MTDLEDRLRQALAAEAERAQPGRLRPLRAPRAWRLGRRGQREVIVPPVRNSGRLLAPVVAAVAVIAVIAGVFAAGQAVLATRARSAAGGLAAAALPPFYVTLTGKPGHLAAVVRDTHTGAQLSSVKVPFASGPGTWMWIASGSNQTFALAVPDGQAGERFFLLRVAANGRSAKLAALPVRPAAGILSVTGMALSPGGGKLAITANDTSGSVAVEVASTATGKARTWTAPGQNGGPADPAWADDGRELAFTWSNHCTGRYYIYCKAQVRLLDTAAAGRSLLASRVIVPEGTVPGAIQTALIASDGRSVVASVTRNLSSGYYRGTVVAKVVRISAATGRVTASYRTVRIPYRSNEGRYLANASCQVLSLDTTGRDSLVMCRHLGALTGSRFTPLPGTVAYPLVPAAAW